MTNLYANRKFPNTGNWQDRHDTIVRRVDRDVQRLGFGNAIVYQLIAWSEYARVHKESYESQIGDDYVIGPGWEEIGLGIRQLLNGNIGGLDAGTLDAFILDTLAENGVDTSKL